MVATMKGSLVGHCAQSVVGRGLDWARTLQATPTQASADSRPREREERLLLIRYKGEETFYHAMS